MLVVLAASPSVDRSYLVDALRPHEIHRPLQVAVTAGGKALNVGRVARALGTEVHVVVALGGAGGAEVGELLAADGVEATVVPVAQPTRTCISIGTADGHGLTELYEVAVPLPATEADALAASMVARLRSLPSRGWVAVAGSWPAEPELLAELCRVATGLGWRVAVDTHGQALAAALSEGPDVVKVNRSELQELDAAATAAATTGVGAAGLAVVTDGARGAEATAGGRRWRVGVPATGPYPVGSGDSFLAGLLTGLVESDAGRAPGSCDPAQALALAAGAACANAMVLGAGNLDPALARELAGRVPVQRL